MASTKDSSKLVLRTAMMALCALFATSCMEAQAPEAPPKLSYSHMQPFNLNVSRVEVVDEFKPSMQSPHMEHLLQLSPAKAVRIWVKDRIRPVSEDKLLQVIIKDASVTETALPRTEGIKGAFTKDQAYKYDATIELELRIYGITALSEASVTVSASRSRTAPEDSSPAARMRIQHQLVAATMESLNAELEKNIYAYFGNYLSFSDATGR